MNVADTLLEETFETTMIGSIFAIKENHHFLQGMKLDGGVFCGGNVGLASLLSVP